MLKDFEFFFFPSNVVRFRARKIEKELFACSTTLPYGRYFMLIMSALPVCASVRSYNMYVSMYEVG